MHSFSNCPGMEDLAALIEGRVSDSERVRLLEHVDSCQDCFEVYADGIRYQESRPLTSRWFRDRRSLYAAASLVAATVALIVGLRLFERWGGFDAELPAQALVTTLLSTIDAESAADNAAVIPDAGLAFAAGADLERLSFRVGVRVIDLEVARQADSYLPADRALLDLTSTLLRIDEAHSLAASLGRIRDSLQDGASPRAAVPPAASLEEGLGASLDPLYYALGKWAECCRLAASFGHFAFLRDARVLGFIQAPQLEGLEADVRDDLASIEEILSEGPTAAELPGLADRLDRLIRRLSRRM